MARKQHLINVHTSTSTTAPEGASLYLGEIAVQHTPNEPALWIKMGSAQTSTDYEKFIGETEILSLIDSSKILGSGYTYSGLPYVNSATTIADAYSAITNEMILNEKVGAAALNALNKRVNEIAAEASDTEEIVAGAINVLSDRIGTVETQMTGDYIPLTGYELASGTSEEELALTEEDTVNEAFGKLQKQMLDNEEAIAAGFNYFNGRIDDIEEEISHNTGVTALSGAVITIKNDLQNLSGATEKLSANTAGFVEETIEAVGEINGNVSALSGAVESISAKTSGVLTLNLNGVEQGQYSPSANTTINLEAIQEVTGADVLLTGYELASGSTEEELVVVATDTVNEAIGKLQKQNYDNEAVVAGALNDLDERVAALEEGGSVEPLSAATISLSAATVAIGTGLTTLSGEVISLSASVVSNSSDITALSASVVTNESNISALSASVVEEVSALTINLNTLSGAVVSKDYVVAQAINSLNDRIGAIEGDSGLTTLSASVVTNGNNITAVSASVVTNKTGLNALSASVITNGNNITAVSASVVDNKSNITAVSASVVTNGNNIAAVSGSVIGASAATVAIKTGLDNLSAVTLTGISLNNTPLTVTNHNVSVPVTTSGSGIASASATGSVADAKAVKEYVENVLSSSVDYKGATASTPASAVKGDLYIASADFMIGSDKVETGDFIIYNGTGWDIIEKNLDGAITGSLTANTITLGDSANSVKSLANGTAGQVLKMGSSAPEWGDLPVLSSATTGAGNVVSSIQVNGHEITYVKDFTAATNADLTSLSASVVTNKDNVTALSASVVTNKSNISALSAGTIQLSGDVVAYVNALSASVVTNDSDIDALSGAVVANEGNISAVSASVVTNKSNIGALSASVVDNKTGLNALSASVVTNGNNITAVSASVVTNKNNVTALSASVVDNKSNITALSASVVDNKTGLNALSASVVTNGNNITALSASVVDNKNEISAVSIDLTVLSGVVEDNEYVIAQAFNSVNDRITALEEDSGLTTLSASVVSNKNDIVALSGAVTSVGHLEEITWTDLKSLRDSSGLTPGMQYRITDYNTTTVQSNTQAAGHQFDLIVVADNEYTLNENARAIRHTGDSYFSASTLETWEIKYDIDNDATRFAWADTGATGRGVIYWMKDEWNNECPYDFKNIQFARWEQTNPVGYVFDDGEWDYVQDSDQTWVSDYDFKAGFYSTDGSSNDVMLFHDDDLGEYKKKISYTVSSTPTYCYTFGRGLDTSLGKNVRSNVIKKHYDFYSNKLQLNDIVFLQTTLIQICYSNTFGDRCYSNTFGGDYDSNTCNFNTFGNGCNSNTFRGDCDSNTFGNGCYSNTFGGDCNSNTFGDYCYNNTFGNGCYSNTFRYECYSNTFRDECYSNTFGNNCCSNAFGSGCYYNTFGNNCTDNTFGRNCKYNTFGNGCEYNTFGNNCTSDAFEDNCGFNAFGNDCYFNAFGNDCGSNTFGNYCLYNTFGNNCIYNTFGKDCTYNTFGESVQNFITGNATGATTSAQTKNFIRYLIVENGVQNVNAYCTGTTSASNCCQNIKIGLGIKGTPSNRLQIDITPQIGATDSVTYQTTNARVINIP